MIETGEAAVVNACENIDALCLLQLRTVGLSPVGLRELYNAARKERPISYEIARALLAKPGARVGIVTGSISPAFPLGETDGPLGSLALGAALARLGFDVEFLAEASVGRLIDALSPAYGRDFEIRELSIESPDDHARTALDLGAAIVIEKAGISECGILHASTTGASREGTRARVDGLIRRMNAEEKLTVGIGDGGNEIGWGSIYRQARSIFPLGARCACPQGKGIIALTPTTYFFPVAISNWGAYAVAAALAALTGDGALVHTAQRETEFLRMAAAMDYRDGVYGRPGSTLDGVPGEASTAIVQLLESIVELVVQVRA